MYTYLASDCCDITDGSWPTENNVEHSQYSDKLSTSSFPAVTWLNFDEPCPAIEPPPTPRLAACRSTVGQRQQQKQDQSTCPYT